MSPDIAPAVDAGSFRDRDGRIYHLDGRIIRGVSESALKEFQRLQETQFYADFLKSGRLVSSEFLDRDQVPLPEPVKRHWAGFIEHGRVPVISYPYERPFGMLRDAALLQLELVEAAVLEGMTLKDASPYNVQFIAGEPVFIDIASFETLPQGGTWTGYRQFCEMYLFPLMLQAYKGVEFQPLLRGRIDGIAIPTAARLFSWRDRFRPEVLTHVWLQAKLDRRYGETRSDLRSELKSAGFNRDLILANVRKLRKQLAKLEWEGEGSAWGGYEDFHNYSEQDRSLKASFVEQCVADSGANIVWDIGCNTGEYSLIAARHARLVLAMDQDQFAVERLYRRIRAECITSLLPLVQDVADPSPDWGWRNRERSALAQRARPDLVLCLALVHHVVISANVPLGEFVGWLAELTEQVVIEYVSRSDEKVQTLLRNKEDKYSDYNRKSFELELERHFGNFERQTLQSGNRFLYWS